MTECAELQATLEQTVAGSNDLFGYLSSSDRPVYLFLFPSMPASSRLARHTGGLEIVNG